MAENNNNNLENKELYRGQKHGQIRHGVGVYTYLNGLYTYKGEWKDGLKHGNGEFFIRGGGFYKGAFFEGEIEGNGERYYEGSGATYVGHFCKGERHGLGRYVTNEGVYEGNWVYNKIDGFGTFSKNDGSSYEGEWHSNKRHGEGTQIYIDGSTYEGCWVQNLRHGHGIHTYVDASVYEGQWKYDVCQGEGALKHVSGIHYFGPWVKGYPAFKASSLKFVLSPNFRIEAGVPFNLELKILNEKGSILECESGREILLQVMKRKDVEKKDLQSSIGKTIDYEAVRSGRFSFTLMTEYKYDTFYNVPRSTPNSPCTGKTSIGLSNDHTFRQVESANTIKGRVVFKNLLLPDFKNEDVSQVWKKLKNAKTIIDTVQIFKRMSSLRVESHKLTKPSSETDLAQLKKLNPGVFPKSQTRNSLENLSPSNSKNQPGRESAQRAAPKQGIDLIIVARDVTPAPLFGELPLIYHHVYTGQPSLLRLTRKNE